LTQTQIQTDSVKVKVFAFWVDEVNDAWLSNHPADDEDPVINWRSWEKDARSWTRVGSGRGYPEK
jgi:hypothetical protein